MDIENEFSGVQLSATNQTTETHRITRLHRVVSYAIAKTGLYSRDLLDKLVSLDDHKGDLTVVWKRLPRPEERQAITEAWQNGTVGDGGGPIEHFLLQPWGSVTPLPELVEQK